MKASELVDLLNTLINKHSDVRVLICYEDGYITDFDHDRVKFWNYMGTEEDAIVIDA